MKKVHVFDKNTVHDSLETDKLKKHIKKAEIRQSTALDFTIDKFNAVIKEIKNFIRENNLIVYGGRAHHELIKRKNSNDYIYEPHEMSDYEFYSPRPIHDIVALGVYLDKKGFEGSRISQAMHDETFKLHYESFNFCDVSYMPKYIFDKLPHIKHDGMRFVTPKFYFIDVLRTINDPITSNWRLEKTIKRSIKLFKYYPLSFDESKIGFVGLERFDSEHKEITDIIRKNLISGNNQNLMMIGYYAYYYFKSIAENNTKQNLQIPYYEVLSFDYENDVKYIYNALIEELRKTKGESSLKSISTREYYPFFQFYGRQMVFLYKNKPILIMYQAEQKCLPYIDIQKKKIKIGSFSVVLMMIISLYYRNYIMNDRFGTQNMDTLMYNLIDMKNKYLQKNNKSTYDDTPFKEFIVNCMGKPVDVMNEFRANISKNVASGKGTGLFCHTIGEKINERKMNRTFNNTSGNQIKNPKKRTPLI